MLVNKCYLFYSITSKKTISIKIDRAMIRIFIIFKYNILCPYYANIFIKSTISKYNMSPKRTKFYRCFKFDTFKNIVNSLKVYQNSLKALLKYKYYSKINLEIKKLYSFRFIGGKNDRN